jgi:phospholipase/lecithinase/hemolysin
MFDVLRAPRRALVLAAALAAAIFLGSCGGGSVSGPPLFMTMVAFGASVSDNGNSCNLIPSSCPPSPPYASGRFSNGPLWIDAVAARYGASAVPSRQGGTNWAYAGARTGAVPGVTAPAAVPSLAAQIEQYLQRVGYVSKPETLFIVDATTVGNNINDALTLSATNPNAPVEVLTAAVTDVVSAILRLYASGARHIAVLNAPNVGLTPRVQALGPAAVAGATQLSAQFNGALAQQIAGLRATSPGLNVYVADLFALNMQIAANPAAFGFTNVSEPCFNVAVAPPTLCANPAQYAYWDTFHPTQSAGKLIADIMIAAIGR